jgi:RNA polymerase sigma factor (sigma-70 family)
MEFARKLATNKRQSLKIHIEQSDLESEAIFGLVKAGQRFDRSRGVSFASFVAVRVAGSLEDWLSYQHSRVFFEEVPDTRAELPDYPDYRALRSAMTELPERLRIVLHLRYWSGLSLHDIAEEMGLCYARVWQLEQKAFAYLRGGLRRRKIAKLADAL